MARAEQSARIETIAVVAIVAHVVVRIALSSRSYFQHDDFWYTSGAEDMPLGEFLFQNYAGHLMPGQFALVWLAQMAAPLQYSLVVAVLVALQTAAAVVVWRLLRELVGVRPAALAGLLVFLFAPLTVVTWVWYASALQTVTFQLALAAMLLHHVRFARRPSRRSALWAVAWYVGGLLLWEKGLVAIGVAALVMGLWFPDGRGLKGVLRAFARDRTLWFGYLAATIVYLPIYLALTEQVETADPTLSSYPQVLWRALTNSAVPYLLGGPFSGAEGAIDALPTLDHGVWYAALFGLIVAVTILRRHAAWRAWALFFAYLAVLVVTVNASRGGFFGPSVGNSPRYFADLTVIASISVTLALAPVSRPAGEPDGTEPSAPRRWSPAVPVAAVYIACCVLTSVHVVRNVPVDEIRSYVANARNDLDRLGEVSVVDEYVGKPVLAFGTARLVLTPMRLPVRFDAPAEQLYRLGADGHLLPLDYQPAAAAASSDDECVARVTDGAPSAVALDRPLFDWRWAVRVDYVAAADGVLTLTAGGLRQDAPVRAGTHRLFFVVPGSFESVQLRTFGANDALCVTSLDAGAITELDP